MPREIRRRDGSLARFRADKISFAILKAFEATGKGNEKESERLTKKVVELLDKKKSVPSVDEVQDTVEQVLIYEGYSDAAKSYILYRKEREKIRAIKSFIDVKDDLKLTVNAVRVLKERYLLRDENGMETPSQMLRRVSKAIAAVEANYGMNKKVLREMEDKFFGIMSSLEFLPNSPCLMNAGTGRGQLSACFVLPIEDSLTGIFDALKNSAIIHQSGGGTGFSFSRLRPKGDAIKEAFGSSSGPVSFMRIFNEATDVMKQGGRRRGANMGVLRVDHPDIIEFIKSKDYGGFANFNLSVGVTKKFITALLSNKEYDLINPRTLKTVKRMKARDVFNFIASSAWRTGDPGVVFIDKINEKNPTPHAGEIEATNPCGEQPLLAYESCNLGSINLAKFVSAGKINWNRLSSVVQTAIRFLDNVIDANSYPVQETEKVTKANRKIGLGIMGFAEFLIKLNVPYDTEEAAALGEKVMAFIWKESVKASESLGEERGNFPNFFGSVWEKKGHKSMRNASLTTVAPTGTVSIIAGCSSGIEPLFAVSFVRNVMEGTRLVEVNQLFEKAARDGGFYSEQLMMDIARNGSVQNIRGLDGSIKRIFVTALDIAPEWHVKIQAAFQKYSDSSVSKTVNLPETASIDDVKGVFLMAYKLGCKGITIYRYGSRENQVLTVGEYLSVSHDYSGGCSTIDCHF
ncbi:MAG: adenosylcobalamin-dependent ribonucleoside-diphosphate reductase [Candidatus Aenigmarchaeota archaeon]|nr:adenosylcobalamin-dependent ribonucleoside-diphosphate reductase [Candidatus Aenigmarchaeota archaeon]